MTEPRRPKLPRMIRMHARLFAAAALGLILALLLPWTWSPVTRGLIGWDAAVAIFLSLSLLMMLRADAPHINRRAEEDDEGALALLLLTVAAAVVSIIAIVIELGASKDGRATHAAPYLGLAALTIALSWLLIHTIFALHYARIYYTAPGPGGAGLVFPEDERPDYWDFIYFSFVVGMTFQVSDVQVTSKPLRRTVVAHGLVSFVFDVTILAMAVNLGANLI